MSTHARSALVATVAISLLTGLSSPVAAHDPTGAPYDPYGDPLTSIELDVVSDLPVEQIGQWTVVHPATGEALSSGPLHVFRPTFFRASGKPTLAYTPTSSFCQRLLTIVQLEHIDPDGVGFTPPTEAEVRGCKKALTDFSDDQALIPMAQVGKVADFADYDALLNRYLATEEERASLEKENARLRRQLRRN